MICALTRNVSSVATQAPSHLFNGHRIGVAHGAGRLGEQLDGREQYAGGTGGRRFGGGGATFLMRGALCAVRGTSDSRSGGLGLVGAGPSCAPRTADRARVRSIANGCHPTVTIPNADSANRPTQHTTRGPDRSLDAAREERREEADELWVVLHWLWS